MKKKFEIQYYDDVSDESRSVVEEFEDTFELSAELQALDYAYSLASKGWHKVMELTR